MITGQQAQKINIVWFFLLDTCVFPILCTIALSFILGVQDLLSSGRKVVEHLALPVHEVAKLRRLKHCRYF
jgi:hypothetical protein